MCKSHFLHTDEQCFHHIEISQLFWLANHLTGFCVMIKLVVNSFHTTGLSPSFSILPENVSKPLIFQMFSRRGGTIVARRSTEKKWVNSFHASVSFLYHLKTTENLWLSDDFRGYRNGTWCDKSYSAKLVQSIMKILEWRQLTSF